MRDLDECKAEVLRRSGQQIRRRRRMRTAVLAAFLPLCIVTAAVAAVLPRQTNGGEKPAKNTNGSGVENGGQMNGGQVNGGTENGGGTGAFSFALTWDRGECSYDSRTGLLIRDANAADPARYRTTCFLPPEEREEIRALLEALDAAAYPDSYDPHGGGTAAKPPMTLILTVRTGQEEKTIAARGIADTFTADNERGQRFLQTCRRIIDMLTATAAWKALPEAEVLYR